jgi:ABC-type dipeptide/oligopeptide/nickel transport system permease subunit
MATGTLALPDEQAVSATATPHRAPQILRLARHNPLGAFGAFLVIAFIVTGIAGPWVAPYDPKGVDVEAQLEDPSLRHPMGTNNLGQDVLSRILAGARLSLTIGAAAVFIGVLGGALVGIISGYFGGVIDSFIQRTGEAGAAFPGLILYLTLIAALGRGEKTIIIGIAITALIGGSRVLRALTLVIKTSPFVEAARAAGATEIRILFTHIIPNVVPIAIVIASGALGAAVLAEAALSFLGIGVEPGTPSWGIDLSGRNLAFAKVGHWHLVMFPGIALSLVVLGFNLLGDTLRDVLDPRLRGSIRR